MLVSKRRGDSCTDEKKSEKVRSVGWRTKNRLTTGGGVASEEISYSRNEWTASLQQKERVEGEMADKDEDSSYSVSLLNSSAQSQNAFF